MCKVCVCVWGGGGDRRDGLAQFFHPAEQPNDSDGSQEPDLLPNPPPQKKNTTVTALPLLGPHIPTSPPRNPIRGNNISGICFIKDFIRPSTTTLRGSAAVASRRRLPLPATQLTTQRNPLRSPPPSSANPLRAQPRARAPSGAAESQRARRSAFCTVAGHCAALHPSGRGG